jgi:hypothetical protein
VGAARIHLGRQHPGTFGRLRFGEHIMKIAKSSVVTTTKSKAAKAAPAAQAKGATKASKATDTKTAAPTPSGAASSTKNGVNFGKTTGMRVMAFQDHTLAVNDQPSKRLTDTELARLWREEFPNSRAVMNGRITEAIVRGVRNLYNHGVSGHGTIGQPANPVSVPYVIENGKRVASVYTRAKTEKPEPTAAHAATPTGKGAAGKAQKAQPASAVSKTAPAAASKPRARVVVPAVKGKKSKAA